jgi:hypothetical protein
MVVFDRPSRRLQHWHPSARSRARPPLRHRHRVAAVLGPTLGVIIVRWSVPRCICDRTIHTKGLEWSRRPFRALVTVLPSLLPTAIALAMEAD